MDFDDNGVRADRDCGARNRSDQALLASAVRRIGHHRKMREFFRERDGGEIELGFRQEGAGWRLWVYDNGHGLPPEHVADPGKSFGRQLLATLAAAA